MGDLARLDHREQRVEHAVLRCDPVSRTGPSISAALRPEATGRAARGRQRRAARPDPGRRPRPATRAWGNAGRAWRCRPRPQKQSRASTACRSPDAIARVATASSCSRLRVTSNRSEWVPASAKTDHAPLVVAWFTETERSPFRCVLSNSRSETIMQDDSNQMPASTSRAVQARVVRRP